MVKRRKDGTVVVDQERVTSTVEVDGRMTTRVYSDGAEQIQVWPTEDHANDYAASVRDLGA